MKLRYWLVIATYILIAQLSAVPLALYLVAQGMSEPQAIGTSNVTSFTLGLIIILFLLKPDMANRHDIPGRSTRSQAIGWSILGILMAYGGQIIANMINQGIFGVQPGSENTAEILALIESFPFMILIVSIIGPILEEIIFRMIIFGALYKRFNFAISAFASSLIFAAVHFDFNHLLIYTVMGFIFAYLYIKTKRIIVPIIAHVGINTIAVLLNFLLADYIDEILEQYEAIEQALALIMGVLL
ncbi:CPBP family intramembrane glutamic endopeptidase [Alkalihalobacillus pseudalcaliphilus]|uniref:CPBP family intramembrane glutamic endopeptidase n=1 Tax=Alkalihalobacillus pseudalcaliphilus TaxID=79884 RepID=UPI00064DD642|nr:CPBP family intramembrane glutamic endopeptidase [Alkalihalobacillus pseudalcaliphilus]KMK74381.1 peptidase [Alkalihalobacillus pseudalcaliphilus]